MSGRLLGRFAAFHVPTLPRWLDIGFWLVATLLCARLAYLPQARALGGGDTVSAAAGQWLVLDGLARDAAINIKVPLGGDAGFAAPRASLDPRSQTYLASVGVAASAQAGPLRWAASDTGKGASSLIAILSPTTPDARIALGTVGGGKGITLRVDRGAFAISLRLDTARDDTARGIIDVPGGGGQRVYAPWQPLTFMLATSDPATLTFASSASPDIWLQGDGVNEGPLAVTNVEVDADAAPLTRLCGGPAGAIMLWSVLFQPRPYPIPERSRCRPGFMTVGTLSMTPGALAAAPGGSAYVAGELPLLTSLESNHVLHALILALLAYPAARLTGLIKVGKKSAPAPIAGADAAPTPG